MAGLGKTRRDAGINQGRDKTNFNTKRRKTMATEKMGMPSKRRTR